MEQTVITSGQVIAIATTVVGALVSTVVFLSRMIVKQFEKINTVERTVGKYEGKYEGIDYMSTIIIEEVRGIAHHRDLAEEKKRDTERQLSTLKREQRSHD